MKQSFLLVFGLLLLPGMLNSSTGTRIVLEALEVRGVNDRPLVPGICFAYRGVVSDETDKQTGATQLELPSGILSGQQINLQLVQCPKPGSKRIADWFLVTPQINIPGSTAPAEVVLMRRSTLRQIAAEARDVPRAAAPGSDKTAEEDQKRALVEAAARRGLTPEQLETAIRSFAETQDPKDRGIAAYLERQYSQAEDLLSGAAEKKTSDLIETLQYLGAAQFEQAKFQAAAESFRKALALRGEDSVLLNWLGGSLYRLARWSEAEPLMRRALAIAEKSYGPGHPEVATDLNNLAVLLQDTNRLVEAEPLKRRALVIDEKSYGPDHPKVARDLNNLASLLQATNRLVEAEPLMRRALAIDEKSYGPDHPKVATDLNNLASLLQATNRLAEAEPLKRRALVIDEKSYGPDHPNVARDLNNLASLLQATNRLTEAEPLMRRALVIAEKSYGPDHPDVATGLNNLALLLKATNRLVEAEPLMRRAVVIFVDFKRRTGHEHPHLRVVIANYTSLLNEMGRSQAEIEEAIKALLF